MFLLDSLFGDCLGLIIAVLVVVIGYFKWTFLYWNRRNVPYLKPEIPFGNVPNALRGKEHIGVSMRRIYGEMKSKGWKYGGVYIFTNAHFFPLDLNLIKTILTKDFQYFTDRHFYYNEKDPLQAHLLNLSGTKWKNLRAKLTPTFTSGKMKMMFQVMADCESVLHEKMNEEISKKQPINIKEILARFTTNIIGSCAFGLDFKALEDENSPFRIVGRKMFTQPRWKTFKRAFCTEFPKIAHFLNISLATTETNRFILNMVQKVIDHREKNNYTRNDFMQLLIKLKNEPYSGDHDGKPLTMDEVASQCLVFFGAGFETSSTLMTFALYELSKHQDIQDRLREEIKAVLVKHDNKVTYDSVQDMKYLSQVIDETLRLHPPGTQLHRKCIEDYKIPEEDVIIEKDTIVTVSILGIHYDEEYYPNPSKFDPDRFTDVNKSSRPSYAHLPFGEGPRNCIGMRFGLLQSKVGLVALLKNYRFTLNEKTLEPLIYNPSSIVLSVKGELWLNAQKI